MFDRVLGSNLTQKVDRLGTYAAALAYCFVLSMVPFLALTFAVGMEVADELDLNKHYAEHYAQVLGDIIPASDPRDTQRIFDAVQHSLHGGLLTIGFLLAIYTSYNLMDQIIRTINFIFDDPRRPQAWSWLLAGKTATLLLIWMLLLLLVSIGAVEAGILRHVLDSLGMTLLSRDVAATVQVLVTVGALFGTLYLTYYVVPAKRYKRHLVLEGSLLASCGWIICSLVFAYVMPKILATNAAYKALGSVVAILLWAQFCAWSIILGACWIVRFSSKK